MLDHYQVQLTRMLEAERYGDARDLLRFLLQCQGEEQRHYEEWENLLNWLDMAFPSSDGGRDEEAADENELRRQALDPGEQDESYVQQVLYIMKHHPMIDQQLLALERAALLRHPEVDGELLGWLSETELHPVLQFKVLQCLRKRGVSGRVKLQRLGEESELEIELTPLGLEDFPAPVQRIVERVEQVTEPIDPTLPHFARELWKECLQFLYGTTTYGWMLHDDEESIDCFAASLHLTLLLVVHGTANDDEVRDAYGITDALRFRYEQASRVLRQVADASRGKEDDSEP
ncbi:hypothetical protein IDH44_05545 [Paenibacillus sp. IB182496]|uniref:Uncharacterized protein n=2 Tax=Paenibacillus sabuli TaxID=2772509 RepID=A0A927BQ40_9BACL|nr:hypothetical protein [Paenibacillus sabuli]